MEVSWSRKAETFHLEISIPCNTTAEVYLPADSLESVYLNGRKFSNSQYAVFRELKDGRAVFTLLSGHYTFGSRLP
jgi:alpha-L-rhamnosidase